MIQCKHPYSLTQLRNLSSLPLQQGKRYWRGIAHHDLIQTMLKVISQRTWEYDSPAIELANKEQNMVGAVRITDSSLPTPSTGSWSVAVRNSNTQDFALQIYFGTRLSSGGGVPQRMRRLGKHTEGLASRLGERIAEAIDQFTSEAPQILQEIKDLRQKPLEPVQVSTMLTHARRQGWIPNERVPQVDDHYHRLQPSAWNLLESFALIAAKSPALKQLPQVFAFYQHLLEGE